MGLRASAADGGLMDWGEFRKLFPLPEGEVFLNTGTLGCPAYATIRKLAESQAGLASTLANWEYLNDDREWITGYTPERELRARLGRLFGAAPAEISLTQNATMGVNLVAHGFPFRSGDEVIITDQEHPGARCPFETVAARRGVALKHVALPTPMDDPAEIVALFGRAISDRTKLLAVPHITSALGAVLPVKEICALARSKGVMTLVDGAQVPGHVMLDIGDIGADAYTASLHKWLLAPAGNGFLHVRGHLAGMLWPTQASEAWRDSDAGFRFQQRGTGNPSLLHALGAALDLFEEVGPEIWCRRVTDLGRYLRTAMTRNPKLKARLRFNSPTRQGLCAGITSIELEDLPSQAVARHLWAAHRIRVRDVGAPYGLRVSTAVYTLEGEIDRLIGGLAALC